MPKHTAVVFTIDPLPRGRERTSNARKAATRSTVAASRDLVSPTSLRSGRSAQAPCYGIGVGPVARSSARSESFVMPPAFTRRFT